jgi:hypothetical protein
MEQQGGPTILWGRGAGSQEERWWRKESWIAGPPPPYNSYSRAPTIPYCRPSRIDLVGGREVYYRRGHRIVGASPHPLPRTQGPIALLF